MSDDTVHEQIIVLSGRNALHTAAVGGFVIAPVVVVAWLIREESWPVLAMSSLVFVPFAGIGVLVVGLAAWFHTTRSIWRLRADEHGVSMTMETSAGKHIKHEFVRADELRALQWVEGDSEVSAGVRLQTHNGPCLFVPADSFDAPALWTFLSMRFAALPRLGRKGI